MQEVQIDTLLGYILYSIMLCIAGATLALIFMRALWVRWSVCYTCQLVPALRVPDEVGMSLWLPRFLLLDFEILWIRHDSTE